MNEARRDHLLPEVDGTAITVTKKNSVAKLQQQPTIIDNNQREVFSRLPGILIAEQQNPAQLNLSYRGIGNPQESEYVLSLQDGVPIGLNWLTYPTQYYIPVPQTISGVQLIRGGGSLLYGPQPQPVINYISTEPEITTPFGGTSEQVWGSRRTFSSFNRVEGKQGPASYAIDYTHRQSDGQRANGDYSLNAADVYYRYQLDARRKLNVDLHSYGVHSGQPGFLTIAQFNSNAKVATTPADRLWTSRSTAVVGYQDEPTEGGLLTVKGWMGYTELQTRVDAYATPTTNPTATAAVLEDQQFSYTGADVRYRQRWGRGNAVTVGATAYHSNDPWSQFGSADPSAPREGGPATGTYNASRRTDYGAAFAESVFRWGRFHVVPSIRFEYEDLKVHENVASSHPTTLLDKTYHRHAPLLGLGFGNDFGQGNETYVNVAQSYRPLRYRDVISPRSSLGTSNDPAITKYVTYEAGVHGWPATGLYYDASVFQIDIQNRIESQSDSRGSSVNVNSGDARNKGVEVAVSYDWLAGPSFKTSGQSLDTFFNVAFLDSQITSSLVHRVASDPTSPTLAGNTLAYAPRYIARAGVSWRRANDLKMSLSSATVAHHYWADSNLGNANAPAVIPSYTVADFSFDYRVTSQLRMLGGVANLFDRKYYSRVFFVNGGIEPAEGRKFYAGAALEF